jgi:hypothetical protein
MRAGHAFRHSGGRTFNSAEPRTGRTRTCQTRSRPPWKRRCLPATTSPKPRRGRSPGTWRRSASVSARWPDPSRSGRSASTRASSAACYQKADEVDDSSGDYGRFGGSLFCRWVTARQAADADPGETVDRLFAWMVHDQYGFWHGLEEDLASVLDAAGQQACILRIKQMLGSSDDSQARTAYHRVQLDGLLRAIYVAQRDTDSYLALAEETGITAKDCVAVASMFAAEQEHGRALEWVERGFELDAAEHLGSFADHDLRDLQRQLLTTLGRHDEAVQAVWAGASPRRGLPQAGRTVVARDGRRHRQPRQEQVLRCCAGSLRAC